MYSKHLDEHDNIDAMLIEQVANEVATEIVPAEVHMARIQSLIDVGFVWNAIEAQWLIMYGRLAKYKEIHNTTLVPKRYEKDPQLGRWVKAQRVDRKDGTLSARHIALLDEIGFVWDPWGDKWNEMFEMLCAYKSRFGHVNVPTRYSEDPELGQWVNVQRRYYKMGRLASERVEKLESVGFVWVVKNRTKDRRQQTLKSQYQTE